MPEGNIVARTVALYEDQRGEERREVSLRLEEDGSIELSARDRGPAAEKVLGSADYRYGSTLNPDVVNSFCLRFRGELPDNPSDWLMRVLIAMYEGDARAVSRFRKLSASLGIRCKEWPK